MTTGQPYQLMPPLTPEEYAALRADIAARGVMVPIEVDETGAILDGHHRAAIADELGIEAPRIVRSGWSEGQKRDHVLKVNLLRRQLGPIAWADAFRLLAAERGVRLGKGKGDPSGKTANVSVLAAELGVNPRTARRRLSDADKLADRPDLAAVVDAGEVPVSRALRIARTERHHAELARQRAELARHRATAPDAIVGHTDERYPEAAWPVLTSEERERWEGDAGFTFTWLPRSPDPDVRDGDPERPLAWDGDTLLMPFGNWRGVELHFGDGSTEQRRWWEWASVHARAIREAADPMRIRVWDLAIRPVLRGSRPGDTPKKIASEGTWSYHLADHVDAEPLIAALEADLARVRAASIEPAPDLMDPRVVLGLARKHLLPGQLVWDVWQDFAAWVARGAR